MPETVSCAGNLQSRAINIPKERSVDKKSQVSSCSMHRRISMTEIEADTERSDLDRSACSEESNATVWDGSNCMSASSPSQQHALFHDWYRERRISDESDWQPDLADICLQLAGEDFRVFALEDNKKIIPRSDSSSSISELSNRLVYAL